MLEDLFRLRCGISGLRAQARAHGSRWCSRRASHSSATASERRPVAAIAAHAGVSPETVYKTFGTKAALAKAVFDLVIAGDDEPVPVAERPAMQAMRDEPDVRRKIAMFIDGLAQRQANSAKVQILIRDDRHVDDSLTAICEPLTDEGLAGMTMLARHLLATGQLRDGIELAEVRDVQWNYLAIDTYERLVLTRGWTHDRYTQWLTRAVTNAICE